MYVSLSNSRYPTWVLWLAAIPLLAAAAMLALFFLTLFLILFGALALSAAARFWWRRRHVRQAPPGAVIEGEYRVVEPRERKDS